MARLAAALFLACCAAPRPALADIAPTPPYVSAPPTFLFIFVVIYALLLASVGLGSLVNWALKRTGASSSKGKLLVVAAVVALVLTVCIEVFSTISYKRSRAERWARSAVRSNLGAIRSTEVAFYAEWNSYVGNQPLTPVADRRGNRDLARWDPNTRFSILGFAPEGTVLCSYSLEGPDWPTAGFTARAECDADGDGQIAVYRITSGSNEIVKSGAPF